MYKFISVFILSLFLILASKTFAIDNILSQDVIRNYIENSGFENGFYPHSFNPKSSGVISSVARSGYKSALFTSITPVGTEATFIIPSLPQGQNYDVYFYYKTSSTSLVATVKDSLAVPVQTFTLGACPSSYCKSTITSVTGGQSYSIVIGNVGTIYLDDFRAEPSFGSVGQITANSPLTASTTSGIVTISIPKATSLIDGYLSSLDWALFNGKQDTLSFSSPLSVNANVVSVDTASSNNNGVLTASDYKTFSKKITSNVETELSFPHPINYNGTVRTASDSATLLSALASSSSGDIINLTANITLTSTLVINKSVKIDGAFALQSEGLGTDPVTLISVTAPNVYITSNVIVDHKKTTNTSAESAITVANTATNFVSLADVRFMEAGYTLRGSFSIGGKVTYTGALANNHRAIIVYQVSAPSEINGVIYDFISEATPRFSFIYQSVNIGTDNFDFPLKVSNNTQLDSTKIQRQFYLSDSQQKTLGAKPALIFDNNYFNHLNGGIGLTGASGAQVLDFYDYIVLTNNFEGDAAQTGNQFKGMLYLTGSGAIHPMGSTKIYYSGNVHPYTLRSAGDYTSAHDYSGIGFNNTVYSNLVPLSTKIQTQIDNSAFSYTRLLPTKAYVDNKTSGGLSGSGTVNKISKWSATTSLTSSSLSDDGTTLDINNVDVKITNGKYFYLGDATTDGSLRYSNSSGAMLIEKRISGVWTELMTIDEN